MLKIITFRFSCSRFCGIAVAIFALLMFVEPLCASSQASAGQQSADSNAVAPRSVLIELYLDKGQAESDAALAATNKIAAARPGIRVVSRTITDNPDVQQRFQKIADFYHFDAKQTPVIYGCGQVIRTGKTTEEFEASIAKMLRFDVFTQEGCTHCDSAHAYLNEFSKRYPGLEIVYRSISADLGARAELQNLVQSHRVAAASTPVFYVCDQLLVGFDYPETTGDRLHQILKKWTLEDKPAKKSDDKSHATKPAQAGNSGVALPRPFRFRLG